MQNIITMARREDPFARVPKTILDDDRLSWRAKGVLSYLLGKPAGWKMRVSDLAAKSQDGKHSVRRALDELRATGYAEYVQSRDRGKFRDGTWKISDSPIFAPFTKKRDAVKPDAENQHHSKKERSKNDCNKNEPEETKETSAIAAVNVFEEKEAAAQWKPDSRTKEQKLQTLRPPRIFPSQREFDEFVSSEQLDHVATYRGELYVDLCRNKWHTWREASARWARIADWRKYVAGLNAKIQTNFQ